MKARDLMVRTIAAVRTDESLSRAAAAMRDHDCGTVVVLKPGGRVTAMLTDRDICMAALRSNRPLTELRVEQAMSRQLFCCGPDDDVACVQDAMSLHQVRRLPVVDADQRILGVISLDDIARAAQRQANYLAPSIPTSGVGRTLGEICRPHLVDSGLDAASEPHT